MSARGRVREGSLTPGPPSQARSCQGAGLLPSPVGPIIGWPSPPVVVPARGRCMAIRVWPCCAPRLAESAVGFPARGGCVVGRVRPRCPPRHEAGEMAYAESYASRARDRSIASPPPPFPEPWRASSVASLRRHGVQTSSSTTSRRVQGLLHLRLVSRVLRSLVPRRCRRGGLWLRLLLHLLRLLRCLRHQRGRLLHSLVALSSCQPRTSPK